MNFMLSPNVFRCYVINTQIKLTNFSIEKEKIKKENPMNVCITSNHLHMNFSTITQLSVMERACARLRDDNRYKLRIYMFNLVHRNWNKCICTNNNSKNEVRRRREKKNCDMRVSALQLAFIINVLFGCVRVHFCVRSLYTDWMPFFKFCSVTYKL